MTGFGEYKEGVGTERANGGDYGGGSETIVALPLNAHSTRYNLDEQLVASTLSTSLGHHGWGIGDQDFNNLQPIVELIGKRIIRMGKA